MWSEKDKEMLFLLLRMLIVEGAIAAIFIVGIATALS